MGTCRKYNINDDYFSNLTEQNCQWAGYLAADGYTREGNSFGINTTLDPGALYKLKEDLQFNGIISISKSKYIKKDGTNPTIYSMSFASFKIKKELRENFNITENKSLTLQPPNLIGENLIKAFIVGYIHGDGHIGIVGKSNDERLHLEICGTKQMLEWINSYFERWFIDNRKLLDFRQLSQSKAHRLSLYNIRAYHIGLSLLGLDCFYLPRKWDKIIEYGKRHKIYLETGKHIPYQNISRSK